jgi:hypothetical protein
MRQVTPALRASAQQIRFPADDHGVISSGRRCADAHPRRLWRPLAVVVTCAALLLAGLLAASPASAKPVPRCTPLTRYAPGAHAWFDDHDVRSQLVVGIDRLVCSAADGATIDLKSWFVFVDGPAVRHLVADLALMHRYHRVRVNVLVGRSGYQRPGGAAKWQAFRRAFAFAHVASCLYSCRSTTVGAVEHGKWVAVSRLRQGGSAVLSTSTNFSTQQYGAVETGILVVGNPALYAAFRTRFASLQSCSADPSSAACGRADADHQPAARWFGAQGVDVYFAPTSTDPVAETLSGVTCTPTDPHRLVLLASLYLSRRAVTLELARLRDEGCTVRVLLEHPPNKLVATLAPRCAVSHDKTVLVDTTATKLVVSGSDNFRPLNSSGQQMVRTRTPAVLAAYERFYAKSWLRAKAC